MTDVRIDYEEETITLPSGAVLKPNALIVGIGFRTENKDNVQGGYDGCLIDGQTTYRYGLPGERLTPEDRKALADLMIQRWQEWAGLETFAEHDTVALTAEHTTLPAGSVGAVVEVWGGGDYEVEFPIGNGYVQKTVSAAKLRLVAKAPASKEENK